MAKEKNNPKFGIFSRGAIITLVLVFGSIFLVLLGGLLGFILLQHRQSLQKLAQNEALQIAEVGINYAQWHLLHDPDNYDFNLIKDYEVGGEIVGQYQLEITSPNDCFPNATIKSTGWTSRFPDLERTIRGIYGKSPLSKYAFLTNSNVWFGSSERVKGLLHSNGGIRMDGSQNSLFSSAKEFYTCKPEYGCFPSQLKPGIWGAGQGKADGLWDFPVSEIDFTAILGDLADLKQKAQPDYYFGGSGAKGYWIEFLGNEFKIYRVTELKEPVWGWNMEEWVKESNSIKSYQEIGTFSLPADCKPIFIEDNLWVSGRVQGRVTVIAAKLPYLPESAAKIIINGNIDYEDSNSVLGLIAQKDVLIPLQIQDDPLEIKAAMLAKEGRVMRYFYPFWDQEPYQTYSIQNSIKIYGSIISKKEWTFTWVDENENIISGYRENEISIGSGLSYQPPPHFPATGNYKIIHWTELK